MDFSEELKGCSAVVTGGGKGIGLATVRALVERGATVFTGARTITPELSELSDLDTVTVVQGDLSSADGMTALTDRALSAGPVQILVNNVGAGNASSHRSGFLDVTDDEFVRVYELNLLTAVRASRALIPGMLERGSGAIVNVSSVNARLPFTVAPDYAASKAAMHVVTKCLSEEFSSRGIRVNTLSPGAILTPLWESEGGAADSMSKRFNVDRERLYSTEIPRRLRLSMRRMGTAEEVAEAISFLVSDRASYITGVDLAVDGGFIKTT